MSAPHFLSPLLAREANGHALRLARTGEVIATRVELAGDSATRRRGLLGRSGLDPDTALVLAPCNSIHTFFMRFAIDVVFADRHGRVVKLVANVRPWRIALAPRAFATLEFAAGWIARRGLRPGDLVEVTGGVPPPVTPLSRF